MSLRHNVTISSLLQAAGGIGGARIILSTLQAASTPPGTTIGSGEALSSIRFAAYSVGERSCVFEYIIRLF